MNINQVRLMLTKDTLSVNNEKILVYRNIIKLIIYCIRENVSRLYEEDNKKQSDVGNGL